MGIMIRDEMALQNLQREWQGAIALKNKVDRLIKSSFATGGHAVVLLADLPHNLCFINFCAVLNDVLIQLRDEDVIQCDERNRTLGTLIYEGRDSLPWIDYQNMVDIKDKRNEIAHDGKIFPRKDCWNYIQAIEKQLKKWQILT